MPAPRTILMTADTVGGVFTYSIELARALAERNIRVCLATMGRPLSYAQARAVRELDNVWLCESAFRLEWMDDPWEDVHAAGEWLLDLEARYAPDLVHLNGYCHASLPWRAPVVVAGHSCVLSWWWAVKGASAPAAWRRYEREVRRGLRSADLVVAPSAAMLAQLERWYGPLPRSLVIPNGRDPRRFAPGDKRRVIFTAGRLWDEAKNVQALQSIAPRLAWPVYVAGEGYRSSEPNLQPLGPLPERDLAQWLAIASIYALPARYEPFGLTVLEAAMSACALVLGDIPSLRENWDGCAAFVAPDDAATLEKELSFLIEDEPHRRRMQQAAFKRSLLFAPRRMANAYLAAYESFEQGRRLVCAS
ncbi:MAG: glycosyltransferase family 4 protein [Bryobacteraceae bacterium]|nr:glycosyltransferase family 4 protein [Bryobacteraceae bacterium]